MNIQERAIDMAISYLKEKNAYSNDVSTSLRKFLKSKFKYSRDVIKYDDSWKEDYKAFKNHILRNIPHYGHELWLNLSSDIENIVNEERYSFSENDITSIISNAEEQALEEYLSKKFFDK